jgi:hypothetical protein
VVVVLQQAARGELPEGVVPDPPLRNPDGSLASNPVSAIPLSRYPAFFIEYVTPLRQRLHALAVRTIELHRWLRALDAHSKRIGGLGFEWCEDDEVWRWVPSEGHVFGWVSLPGAPMHDAEESLLRDLLLAGEREPLAQELLEEARGLPPRAQLVMAVTAAEVAVKQFLMWGSPHAEYAILWSPAPPLANLLKHAVPQVPCIDHPRLTSFEVPVHLRTAIGKANDLRNAIVHRGSEPLRAEDSTPVVDSVRDLLYLFDFFRGYLWAELHISSETRAALRLPADHRRRDDPWR